MRRRRCYLSVAMLGVLGVFFGSRFVGLGQSESFLRLCIAIAMFAFAAYIWKCMLEAMHLSIYAQSKRESFDYWTEFAKQYTLFKLPFAKEALVRLEILADISDAKVKADGATFESYVAAVFSENQALRALLEKQAITKAHWVGVWTWLHEREQKRIEKAFIFDDSHLLHMPMIGEAFSYGQTFVLTKIGRELSGLSLPRSMEHLYARTFSLLEQSLKKTQGANAILVAQSIEDGEEYIQAFIPHIKKKKFIKIETEYLIAIKDSVEFERLFVKTLKEAAHAGNIILVIPHIASLIHAAHAIGYDAMLTLTEYMHNPNIHIIMITDRDEYHATLEPNISIIQAADKIELDVLAPELLLNVAQNEVLRTEQVHEVIFSYQALAAIVHAVIRYSSEHMHDALRDYLDEVVLFSKKQNKKILLITETCAQAYIAEKTGTKGTFADAAIGNNPINVKEVLSKRIMGQDEAVQAVAQAMIRVRAGLSSDRRPLGTFLFLGPTGVGKTETAKALAEVYFGTEDKMLRFDMSEFAQEGSITRLIGSFELGEPGILVIKARDAGHGVILFDEIEKAHEKVQNLMLQILDEGFFSDAKGARINMKNFILIATSNAGSEEIYNANESGRKIDKHTLIAHIIGAGIFKPEFINRFDEVAIFNPLGDRQLASIASHKLAQYAKSLYEKKALRIVVQPAVIDFLLKNIENKAFGGREIQRTIQNHIESVIAKDIISGKARPGSEVTFVYKKEENKLETVYT